MKVYVDSRETKKRKEKAKKYFGDIEIKQLEVGDYVYDDVGIEFKESMDYIASVRDGRIFTQAINLSQNFKHHFIIVYGSMTKAMQNTRYIKKMKYFSVDQFIGSVASLSLITNVLFVDNESQAFKLANKLLIKGNDGIDRTIHIPSTIKKEENKLISFIMLVGGFSKKRAKNVITTLNIRHLKDLLNISYDDLIQIDGIGDKTAKKILNYIK